MFKKLKGIFKKEDKSKTTAERHTRVQVVPFYDVTLNVLDQGKSEKILKVANLSASGVGAIPEAGMQLPNKGDRMTGSMVFPDGKFPVTMKVAHASDLAIGCAFVEEFTNLKNEILRYFSVELAAKELVEVNADILKSEPDGAPRLFRGRKNCELFLVENDGKIVRFQLSLFGNYIEGGEGLKTKLGFLASAQDEKPKYKGTSLVRLVSEFSPEILSNATKYVENIQALSSEQREIICIAMRHDA